MFGECRHVQGRADMVRGVPTWSGENFKNPENLQKLEKEELKRHAEVESTTGNTMVHSSKAVEVWK
jgi:hypothetical protein